MLRALNTILPFAGQHISRRRQHQFVPSISGSATALEDRTLLSAGAGVAHEAAVVHHAAAARHHHAAGHHHVAAHHHAAAHHHHAAVAHHSASLSKQQKLQIIASRNAAVIADDPVITTSNVTGTVSPSSTTGNAASTISLPAGLVGFSTLSNSPLVTTGGLNCRRCPPATTSRCRSGGARRPRPAPALSLRRPWRTCSMPSSTGTSGAVSANSLTNLLTALSPTSTTSSSTATLNSTELSTLLNAIAERPDEPARHLGERDVALGYLLTGSSVATPGSTTTGTISSLTPGADDQSADFHPGDGHLEPGQPLAAAVQRYPAVHRHPGQSLAAAAQRHPAVHRHPGQPLTGPDHRRAGLIRADE